MDKYFNKDEFQVKEGFFMDYYIEQNQGLSYATSDFQKFEKNLLDNVKKIRDKSILLRQPSTDKLTNAFNNQIKENFKVDHKSEAEALKLFQMIAKNKESFKKKNLA